MVPYNTLLKSKRFIIFCFQELKDEETITNTIINLVRLLPAANRDTLEVTLACLNKVAENSMDSLDDDGNLISGNKMDAKNLATLMAPNILHRMKVKILGFSILYNVLLYRNMTLV